MADKPFFAQRTRGKIKKMGRADLDRIIDVQSLNEEQFGVLPSYLFIPMGFKNWRKFMKHGREVKTKRFYTLDQALRDGRTPVQLREEAFDAIKDPCYCSHSFMPFGKDKRKRKVSLLEDVEAARIFAYAHQTPGESIIVKPYDDAKRARIDGAEIIVSVPSRTEGERDFEFKLISIPVVDCSEKYKISLGFGSDHSCGSKRFNIRYRYTDDKESSGVVNVCAHEIAAYLKVIEHYWNKEKNMIPIQMCQFAIPTQETVNYFLKFENNLLIYDERSKAKDHLRKPNRAEMEIGLWALVKELHYDKTFYSRKSRDGDVADYDWSIR